MQKHVLFECSSLLIVRWDESRLFIEIVRRENASGFDAWEAENVREEFGNGPALTVQHDENSRILHLTKCQKIQMKCQGRNHGILHSTHLLLNIHFNLPAEAFLKSFWTTIGKCNWHWAGFKLHRSNKALDISCNIIGNKCCEMLWIQILPSEYVYSNGLQKMTKVSSKLYFVPAANGHHQMPISVSMAPLQFAYAAIYRISFKLEMVHSAGEAFDKQQWSWSLQAIIMYHQMFIGQ